MSYELKTYSINNIELEYLEINSSESLYTSVGSEYVLNTYYSNIINTIFYDSIATPKLVRLVEDSIDSDIKYVIPYGDIQTRVLHYSSSEETIIGAISGIPFKVFYGKSRLQLSKFLKSGDVLYQDSNLQVPVPEGTYIRQGDFVFIIGQGGIINDVDFYLDTNMSSPSMCSCSKSDEIVRYSVVDEEWTWQYGLPNIGVTSSWSNFETIKGALIDCGDMCGIDINDNTQTSQVFSYGPILFSNLASIDNDGIAIWSSQQAAYEFGFLYNLEGVSERYNTGGILIGYSAGDINSPTATTDLVVDFINTSSANTTTQGVAFLEENPDVNFNTFQLGGSNSYLNIVLTSLKDNESKLISPSDLRTAIASVWGSIAVKELNYNTTNAYIGFDFSVETATDENSPFYLPSFSFGSFQELGYDSSVAGNKILMAKRSFNSEDIYTSNMSLSDTDVYFWNTKDDTDNQDSTKLLFITGEGSNLYNVCPYIQSYYIDYTDSINFNMISYGDTGIISENGSVSLNEINYPSKDYLESNFNDLEDKTLFWNESENEMRFDHISFDVEDFAGVTGSAVSISGSEVKLNGYSLEFSDNRKSPIKIGDIQEGTSFESSSIEEMLNRLIYKYVAPSCSIELLTPYDSNLAEVGSYPIPRVKYQINKKSLNTLTTSLTNMIPGSYPPIVSNDYVTVVGESDGIVISPVQDGDESIFTITVNDGQTSASSSVSLLSTYPVFYGIIDSDEIDQIEITNLIKLIIPKEDLSLDLIGSGNLFYMYPSNYGLLSDIKIDNISVDFTFTNLVVNSPEGLWTSKDYIIYKVEGVNLIEQKQVEFLF